ncbi:MAG: DUF2783 domain-containing protein [Proteobacteria bacterium]|nr:DUF2783 domain-containing protein [Pseudomonadota bacterium]
MTTLLTQPRIADPDGFYEALIASQRELSDDEAALMNAKLVLTLANHIGDTAVLLQALALCRPAEAAAQR